MISSQQLSQLINRFVEVVDKLIMVQDSIHGRITSKSRAKPPFFRPGKHLNVQYFDPFDTMSKTNVEHLLQMKIDTSRTTSYIFIREEDCLFVLIRLRL